MSYDKVKKQEIELKKQKSAKTGMNMNSVLEIISTNPEQTKL